MIDNNIVTELYFATGSILTNTNDCMSTCLASSLHLIFCYAELHQFLKLRVVLLSLGYNRIN